MKKLSLLGMLGILMSISACTEISEIEDPQESIVKQEVVISASHEFDNHTKTVLKEDGSVWWKPNDVIGVFSGTYCSYFIAYNMEDAPTADFIGEALVVQGHTEQSNGNGAKHTYWSVFPPDLTNYEDEEDDDFSYWSGNEDYEEPTREKESVNVFLPVKQKGVAGTFDRNLFISIARSDTYKEFRFYNLCGGLAFCVEKEGIHTVTFKGNADEVLAGGVNVIMNSDNRPVVNEVINGKTEVKLTMPEGEYFVPGEWYYIVMLPTTLEEGYSMTFYTDREMGTVVSSKPVEIKRSVFGKLTNPDSGVEYEESIPVESVEIRTESYNDGINVGDTLALTAVITPSDCTFPAVWSSSDPSVATVDEDGNVIGVSEGETRITLTVGDMSDYRWVYVYGEENEDEKVPSFTITSIDLTDVYAITSIYKEEYDRDILYAVNEDGTNSIMKFMLESDNEDFKRYVEENVALSCYTAKWIAEEYLALEDPSFVYKTDEIPHAYQRSLSNYFTNSREYMIFRVKDGKVFSIDEQSSWILHYSPMFWYYNSHILYQPTYYLSRKLYNSDSIYFHDDGTSSGKAPVYRLDFNGNKITGESVLDFSGSQFNPNFGQILVDKNNNLLTYDDGIGYILCSDKSIVPFNTPELADHDLELGTFFEVDYTWYYWTGSRYWYNDYYRHYATLYKVTLENKEVVFTELTSAYRDYEWWYSSSYYRRGNTFIFGYGGNYVVIDMNDISVSHVSVEYHDVDTDYITPDGYYYSMEDGVVYKYDLLSGTPTVIPTDRSQIPPMTPTSPYYDSTNHCYVESGTRLSDSVTITIVTDAETGKVIIYEGKYENASLWVKLP